jgi:aconitate hydratase
MPSSLNTFKTRTPLALGGRIFDIYSLPALEQAGFAGVATLPYSLKILLENLLRREDGARRPSAAMSLLEFRPWAVCP